MNWIKFMDVINSIDKSSIFVIDKSIAKTDYIQLDLSIDNEELKKIDTSSSDELENYINDYICYNKVKVAFGGYLETRNIYARSKYFNEQLDSNDERNIHLGMDIWADINTNVLAALDGEIHSFNNNTNFGDYGPTIIMKHEVKNFIFYTLYGHLTLESLNDLKIGRIVKKGEVISQLGSPKVNGDYPSHLHFQIIFSECQINLIVAPI